VTDDAGEDERSSRQAIVPSRLALTSSPVAMHSRDSGVPGGQSNRQLAPHASAERRVASTCDRRASARSSSVVVAAGGSSFPTAPMPLRPGVATGSRQDQQPDRESPRARQQKRSGPRGNGSTYSSRGAC